MPAPTEEKKIDILYVGRLSIEKGLRTLLDALRLQTRPLEVVIAGDGPLRKRLQAECGSRVQFARWVANDRLPQLIRQARVVVVPSLFEPQGVVVLEAMACGVPVIGSDTGGIPEMIEDGATGWLVPPNDPAALAQAMNTALSDETRRQQMGVAAQPVCTGICAGGFCLPRRATVCRFDTVRCQLTSARDLHAVAVAVARASKVEMLFFPAEAHDDRTAITVPAGFYRRVGLGNGNRATN